MPKLKKQPNNSYYFYMRERKEQLQREGYRFPGGMKDVIAACGPEWNQLTIEQKAPYEEMAKKAKEEEKTNLHNKFTATGESYAQVNERMRMQNEIMTRHNNLVNKLAMTAGVKERVFVIIKTVHSVEEMQSSSSKAYWPLEIALLAFTLKGGLKTAFWSLIDTKKVPMGYASAAKETSEEFGLPIPGSEDFTEDHSDYNKIMKNVKGFIEDNLKDYTDPPTLFCMKSEIEPARSCLSWLITNMTENNEDEIQFLDNLEFCELPILVVKLAEYGKQINPSYRGQLPDLLLEKTASVMLAVGSFDYRDEITCIHHRQGDASQKMNLCCRNIVMRRMFLIFEEFIGPYGLHKLPRHDIEQLPNKPIQKSVKREQPANQTSSSSDVRHSSSGGSFDGWRIKKDCKTDWKSETSSNRSYNSRNESDFKETHSDAPLPSNSSTAWDGCSERGGEGPKSHYLHNVKEAPYPNVDNKPTAVPGLSGAWGVRRSLPETTFTNDDFPDLGASASFGRGQGHPSRSRNTEDESSPWVVGLGRGRKNH